jgi:hypothetical protein
LHGIAQFQGFDSAVLGDFMNARLKRGTEDGGHRGRVIVWTALTASILVYFGLGLWLKPVVTVENPRLERILMTLAAAYVILSVPAKRWLLAQAKDFDSLLLRRIALVVPLLLCEAAALIGLALRLVIGSSHYYVFLLLGLAGMALTFPRKGE